MTFDKLEVRRWDGEEWPEKRISLGCDGHSVAISPRYAVLSEAELNFEHIARCVNSYPDLVEALEGLVAWADGPRQNALEDLERARTALSKAYGDSK